MLLKLDNATSDMDILNLLLEFAEKFTLLPDEQTDLLEFSRLCNYTIPDNINNCLYSTIYGDKNLKHIEWSNHQNIIDNLNEGLLPERHQLAEKALSFPHKRLQQIYQSYMNHSVKPTLKELQQFLYSIKIYHQIIKCENDMDNWLDCIKKIDNKEAVIANLELKLGQSTNWKNKKLWKFYFDFLKENNMKEILEVFRKYTRLFICDKQAVTQYRNELDKFSSWNIPTTKYWIDTIKYEIEFGTLTSAYRILKRALKAVMGKPYHFVVKDKNDLCEKLKMFEKEMFKIEEPRNSLNIPKCETDEKTLSSKPTVYYQNPKHQHLCFRRSFIQNLLRNAKWTILKKLYSTCKFFQWLQSAPLCYRLEIRKNKPTCYCAESLLVNEQDTNFDGLNNLHIYAILAVWDSTNRNVIPKILSKIKICDVLFLQILKQDFKVSEFKFMLSKNIYQILFLDVNIYDRNDKNLDAKEFFTILKDYPSLKCLRYYNENSYIVASHFGNAKLKTVFEENFNFETIYIVKHTFLTMDLLNIIDYQNTKHVTLKNVVVRDENGNLMNKQQLKEFIAENVNPENKVSINIF